MGSVCRICSFHLKISRAAIHLVWESAQTKEASKFTPTHTLIWSLDIRTHFCFFSLHTISHTHAESLTTFHPPCWHLTAGTTSLSAETTREQLRATLFSSRPALSSFVAQPGRWIMAKPKESCWKRSSNLLSFTNKRQLQMSQVPIYLSVSFYFGIQDLHLLMCHLNSFLCVILHVVFFISALKLQVSFTIQL